MKWSAISYLDHKQLYWSYQVPMPVRARMGYKNTGSAKHTQCHVYMTKIYNMDVFIPMVSVMVDPEFSARKKQAAHTMVVK